MEDDTATQNTEIEKIRRCFEETYSDNISKGLYDEHDVQRLNEDDVYTRKFMRPNYKETEIVALMHDSLKWRKEMGIREVTLESIPTVLIERHGMYLHQTDKNGCQILWVEVQKYRKDQNLLTESKLYFAFLMESFFQEHPTDKLVILFDMSNTGLNNYDLDLIRFIVASFKSYYPGILSYLLIYDMPWLFSAIWRIIKTWLRADEVKHIKFANKTTVQEYIDRDNLFDHMGGPCIRENTEASDSSTKGSRKKKVTFAEVEESVQSENCDESLSLPTVKLKHEDYDDVVTIGNILTISPSEDLELTWCDRTDAYGATLTLWACGANNVAFKIKTTSPDKFRVRPSTGVVKADCSVDVNIVLTSAVRGSVNRDRFMVMIAEIVEQVTSISDFWKTVDKSTILEHKVCCSLAYTPPSPIDSPNLMYGDHIQTSFVDNTHLIKQLSVDQRRIERKLNMVLILLFIVVLFMCYQCHSHFHDGRSRDTHTKDL